ncbi:MAG: LysM peptidoglycan-binding domain-containing protein [Melioribacteraceae bacterium]|nr:LysM peptidoglycan-binding domain-containing protein [Melioribacteraceae bacterium]MCF8412740.1 LysM peptidoglycan-binding domain-containing protein [Melioribacteraceae bacterium]MCF8431795.1 LysM peptidoglycan-binding domain-containing protein [Melioribacteraceae bacterium]
MKFAKLFSVVAMLVLLASTSFAQEREMTVDEWRGEINRLTQAKAELTSSVDGAKAEVEALKTKLNGMETVDDCYEGTNKMIGDAAGTNVTDADIDAYRNRVNALAAKINRKDPEKADRQAELNELKADPISALPEFYDKVHNELQRKLDAWVVAPKEVSYTVVKGDHLWGIAKKKEHYDNPFAWPEIYKANKSSINDPNLIYPKQVFKIPNLDADVKAKWDKVRANWKPAPSN